MRTPMCAVALLAAMAVACSAPATAPAPPPPPPADPALPDRIVADVTGEGALRHLTELQRIADENGGNRALGTPGFDASLDYVAGVLRDVGYDVQTPTFRVQQFSVQDQNLAVDDRDVDVTALAYSPTTPASGLAGPLAVAVGEGCAPTDFAGVAPGSVALVRRGACSFAQKATNAAGAGAAALLVANTDDVALTGGSLGEGVTGVVPTGGVSRSDGQELASQAGASVDLTLVTTVETVESRNVIAQTRSGDPGEVVMAGGHLDSVPGGPGINDNGSGVAVLLETAVQLGGSPAVTNAVRFAFWGAEEEGLLGSTAYVRDLPKDERARIALYLNLDMVGSPNTSYLVYDGDDSDREGQGPGPTGSAAVERALVEALASTGVEATGTDFDGRSDYGPFIGAGIPAGGLFTGAEEAKTPEDAQRYGGVAGAPNDPCYHQACDRIDTIDRTALDRNTDALAATVARFGLSTEELARG